ncbi:uncharacterized protein LOC104427626 [Eucalyptus grandis]|uniref:uncharacterized protein LOC104427626 n=1 Tax=Eucalyptus grandis TaxID=71139 RepID=UPI00192E9C06|nr:uncharacterized protein LOC104427626 [Eucalyptus grandis]
MTEFSMSSTAKNAPLSRVLLSCLVLFSSFFLSHPVWFSYFIFLSPYLLKVVTFLSPLLITTFLILLAFLTLSPGLGGSLEETPESKVGFVSKVCSRVLEKLRSNSADEDEGIELSKDLEVYKIFFEEASLWDSGKSHDEVSDQLKLPGDCGSEESEAPVDKFLIYGDNVVKGHSEASATKFEEDPAEISKPESIVEDKLEGPLIQEKAECESEGAVFEAEEKEVKVLDSEPKKVGEEEEKKEDDPLFKGGSKAVSDKLSDLKVRDNNGGECFSRTRQNSRRLGESLRLFDEYGGGEQSCYYSPDRLSESHYEKMGFQHLGSFGSMRREKEWKRTLACKLFEERHDAEGGEGMDLLWEAYENDSSAKHAKDRAKKGKRGGRLEGHAKDAGEVEEEEEEEEEDVDGQFCCLQALKFSAGKMNLGMGRPNLVRISKAFRGIGWLHHVGKHTKKGYN